jgi:cytochrome c553
MMRSVGSVLPAFALALSFGCGGGDKSADTTPATGAAPTEGAPTEGATAEPGATGGLSEQLAQGDKVWADACTTCHGDSGEGKGEKNPAVVGGKALGKFKNGGELLTYLKEKMPKDDPGSLSDADYLAATAWLLSKNGRLTGAQDAITAEAAASIGLQ